MSVLRPKILLALPLLALFLAGCGPVKIGRILDEPMRYRDRNVRVQGQVDRSFGALVTGVYEIKDDTGKIYVLSNGGVPRKGAKVAVKGRVVQGVTVGTRSFGTILREENHKVKY